MFEEWKLKQEFKARHREELAEKREEARQEQQLKGDSERYAALCVREKTLVDVVNSLTKGGGWYIDDLIKTQEEIAVLEVRYKVKEKREEKEKQKQDSKKKAEELDEWVKNYKPGEGLFDSFMNGKYDAPRQQFGEQNDK